LSAHFYAGLAIFTVGLVKKLVFADQISSVVLAARTISTFRSAAIAVDGCAHMST
jgi:hypothetical protein